MELPNPSFLNYLPVPLAFGTSGLRGLVRDITDLEAYINVKGTLRYLLQVGDIPSQSTVVLAGDLRPSTERIMGASVQAIIDLGLQVENAGKIPTPALVLRALSKRRAGVMVTGSHIPFDRNGIKINKSRGEILKSDEAGILAEVERVRAEEYARSAESSIFDASGMLKHSPALPSLDRTAEETYVDRYTNCFTRGSLAGLRVLVYQHSAVGRDLLVRILRGLGAEVRAVGRSDTFIPIDTENITDEQLDRLQEFALAAEADGALPHAIVSTDGDSDRPLVAAIVPAGAVPNCRRVQFLPGDLLGVVVAEYLRADAAAVPISANDAVERRLHERHIKLAKTRIGSPYVIAALDELRAFGAAMRIVGWEANGGFLTGSDIAIGESKMAALPTRDAVLPIVANLSAAREQGFDLPGLWHRLPARFGRAGLIDDFLVTASRRILGKLVPFGDVTEVEFGADGSVLDRSHAGGATLTSATAGEWQRSREILENYFPESSGFGNIVRINVLDGVRIYFQNGDVAHIRPSGNAPQLRIYANADSQARADEIVELAVREPDGILLRLKRAFAS